MQVRVLITHRKSYIRRTVKIYTILYTSLFIVLIIMRDHAIIQVARA